MISRRGFLTATLLGGGYLFFHAFYFEPRRVKVEKVDVRIKDLPRAFDGFTICQITDVHHGPVVGLEYIDRVVALAESLNPDIFVLTGDFVDFEKKYIEPVSRSLGRLALRKDTFAVLGNHDHYADAHLTARFFEGQGIRVLNNTHRLIDRGDATICVGGVNDLYEGRPDVMEAFRGVGRDVVRLLLSHNPDYAELIPVVERVDLVISGHTHGGQVRLPFSYAPVLPSSYGQRYVGGLVRLKATQVYVSRGIGCAFLPVRFNCPPELTLIRLVS